MSASSRRATTAVRAEDGRMRAGYRILGFLLAFYALGLAATLFNRFALRPLALTAPVALASRGAVLVAVASAAVSFARTHLDRRTVVSLGLHRHRAASDLTAGFAFSAGFVTIAVGVLDSLGLAVVVPAHPRTSEIVLVLIGSAIAAGWWEELVFRGYVFQNLEEGLGAAPAVALSCTIYGAVHTLNPHASAASFVVVALIGLSRLAGYLNTRQLWLSMGMHAGWNATQGAVFGLPTSGRASASLWTTTWSAPDWLSGGDFGIEGGALGAAYAIIGILAIRWWTRRRRTRAVVPAAST